VGMTKSRTLTSQSPEMSEPGTGGHTQP